jgi:GNAT superfamily N-acetyltransferase
VLVSGCDEAGLIHRGLRTRSVAESGPDVEVRVAGPADLPDILTVLTTAADWARARGIERWWPSPFPPEEVLPELERGEFYVAEFSSEIVGTLVLRWEDPKDWGEQPPVAGYLHALAVRKDRPLRGVGRKLIGWVEDQVRRKGRTKLRLSCLATNDSLIAYYRSLGFRPVRVVPSSAPGEDRGILLMETEVT